MLRPLRYCGCGFAVAAIVCVNSFARGEEPISQEIIQEYEEAGGIPATFPCWEGWGDDNLVERVPGFHFLKAPTRKLPPIPVPCALSLDRKMFYSDIPDRYIPTGG